jgi:hypothetical protein
MRVNRHTILYDARATAGQEVDARDDLCCLAILLCELAVGQPPFPFQNTLEAMPYSKCLSEKQQVGLPYGEAKSKAEDPQRPLTARGRDEVQRVAAFAARVGLEVNQVRHSGKRRAEETASILAEHLSPAEGVLAVPGPAPMNDIRPGAQRHTASKDIVKVIYAPGRLVNIVAK